MLQCPEYVAVSPVNGDVVVTDFERHTVVVFDKFGRLITSYSGVDNSNAVTPRSGLTDRNRLRQKRILEVCIRKFVKDVNRLQSFLLSNHHQSCAVQSADGATTCKSTLLTCRSATILPMLSCCCKQ